MFKSQFSIRTGIHFINIQSSIHAYKGLDPGTGTNVPNFFKDTVKCKYPF
jgi:hypothetical protein